MKYVPALLVVVFAMLFWSKAHATDNGQWKGQPFTLQQWYKNLMQPDNPNMSCCGDADAYGADDYEVKGENYIVTITDGRGKIPESTKVEVPPSKVQWRNGNPTGHGVLFIGINGTLYCYVPPGGV